MDYEKKYNEALERARELAAKWTGKNKDFFIGDYAYIFPELRESEDEKIRKAIIKSIEENSSVYEQEVSKEQMLSWLEKQKEQSFTHHETDESLQSAVAHQMEDDGDVDDFVRKGIDDIVLKYAELGARWQKEQNPAEWSEEDNIGWDEAFACVTRAEKDAKNEEELQNAVTAEKWLKEIKFKYCVHPWSEEDEKFVRGLIRGLTAKRDIFGRTTFSSDNLDITETINWLKSLRSRPKSSDNWKPSEEQLEALKWLVEYISPSEKYIVIVKNLYEQLKNL